MSNTNNTPRTPKVYNTPQERIEAEKKAKQNFKELCEEFAQGCSSKCSYDFTTISFYGECETTGLRRVLKKIYALVNTQTGQYISDFKNVQNYMDNYMQLNAKMNKDGSIPEEHLQRSRNNITIETTIRVYNYYDVMNLIKLFELDWFQYQTKTTYLMSKHYGGAEEGGWSYTNHKPLTISYSDDECSRYEYDEMGYDYSGRYVNYLEFFWGQFIDVVKPHYC